MYRAKFLANLMSGSPLPELSDLALIFCVNRPGGGKRKGPKKPKQREIIHIGSAPKASPPFGYSELGPPSIILKSIFFKLTHYQKRCLLDIGEKIS
jgi:hypothetical protein